MEPYAIMLRGLTRDEIADLMPDGLEQTALLVRLVHCLTRGHAWTVDLLIRAIARQQHVDTPLRIGQLLDLPVPAAAGRTGGASTVANAALRHLLGDPDDDILERLVSWSAAQNVSQLVRMDGLHSGAKARREPLTELIEDWTELIEDRTEVTGTSRVLHPLLRRLLLHELGSRPDSHPLGWNAVHMRLRDAYESDLSSPPDGRDELEGLRDRVQYHNLALGRLRPVVDHLRELLLAFDVGPWLDRLRGIASAPCRPFAGRPRHRFSELVDSTSIAGEPGEGESDRELVPIIVELLACRWIASDPFGDPEGELLPLIRQQYASLAFVALRLRRRSYVELNFGETDRWERAAWEGRCP
jgi:hypothetical protein